MRRVREHGHAEPFITGRLGRQGSCVGWQVGGRPRVACCRAGRSAGYRGMRCQRDLRQRLRR
jgi:hypothetical protein